MQTLFGVKMNWGVFAAFSILIYVFIPGISMYSFIAILIFLHQFLLLFYAIGYVIPIRYLLGTLMCLQMFVGPALAYNGLDKFQYPDYRMQVPESVYFSYVMPAVICFILGLHINAGKLRGEMINENAIRAFVDRNKLLPYWFIGIGFVSSIISNFFGAELAFVFFLLGNFKFIGVFMLVLGGSQIKLMSLILVFTSIILSSLGEGMFHDLLTWLIMTGAVLAIKYKPGVKLKVIVSVSFIIFVVILQQLKGLYRSATGQGEQAGIETFAKVYEQGQQGSVFSLENIAQSTVRINQGFIITYIMQTVPNKIPYSEGEEMGQILEAAVLPRYLAPNKLNAGDQTLFKKYSGIRLRKGTSMALSSVGDAYINYGIMGGCFFMLLLALLYSEVLNAFNKYGRNLPVLLLFTTLVFYYPIRPDCELQTILGHLVKSCFLIFIIFLAWKKKFLLEALPTATT